VLGAFHYTISAADSRQGVICQNVNWDLRDGGGGQGLTNSYLKNQQVIKCYATKHSLESGDLVLAATKIKKSAATTSSVKQKQRWR
jgi:hypothetical protein